MCEVESEKSFREVAKGDNIMIPPLDDVDISDWKEFGGKICFLLVLLLIGGYLFYQYKNREEEEEET